MNLINKFSIPIAFLVVINFLHSTAFCSTCRELFSNINTVQIPESLQSEIRNVSRISIGRQNFTFKSGVWGDSVTYEGFGKFNKGSSVLYLNKETGFVVKKFSNRASPKFWVDITEVVNSLFLEAMGLTNISRIIDYSDNILSYNRGGDSFVVRAYKHGMRSDELLFNEYKDQMEADLQSQQNYIQKVFENNFESWISDKPYRDLYYEAFLKGAQTPDSKKYFGDFIRKVNWILTLEGWVLVDT